MSGDDNIEPPRPCEHCGSGPDSVLVRRRIVTYEYHRADCVMLNDGAGR
jgi:hypothetical protein